MKTFKDTAGREWPLAINVTAIKRVRDLLEVDLLELVEDNGKLIGRLMTDPVLLVDVVYVVCKPHADAAGVTDEQFGEAMAGDAIAAATDALVAEITGFFRDPRHRARIQKAMEKLKTFEARANDVLDRRMDSGELDEMLDALLAKLGTSSGDVPASSESTLETSPSPS